MSKKQRRTTPTWLPDEVKAIYRKLAEPLPPLNSIDEVTLSQLALFKHQLQVDPDGFTVQQHSQLRQLATLVRQWVEPIEDTSNKDDEDDPWKDFPTSFSKPASLDEIAHRSRQRRLDRAAQSANPESGV